MSEHHIGGTGTCRWSFLWHRHEQILNTASISNFYFDNEHRNLYNALTAHFFLLWDGTCISFADISTNDVAHIIYNKCTVIFLSLLRYDVCVCVVISWNRLSRNLKANSMTRNAVWNRIWDWQFLSWAGSHLSNATRLPSWAKRSAASSGSQPQRHETGLDVVRRAVQLQSFRPLWHNIRCFSFAPWSKMTIEVNQVHQDHLQGLQALSTGQLSQDKTGPSKSSAKAFLIGGASMRWVWQGGSNSPCRDGIALDGCNHAITLQSQPGSEMSRTCSFPSSKPVGTFQFG